MRYFNCSIESFARRPGKTRCKQELLLNCIAELWPIRHWWIVHWWIERPRTIRHCWIERPPTKNPDSRLFAPLIGVAQALGWHPRFAFHLNLASATNVIIMS